MQSFAATHAPTAANVCHVVEQFAADKQELKPEPTLESLGVQLPASTGNGAAAAATGAAAEAAAPEAMDAAAEAGVDGNGDEPGFWAPEEGEADMMEGASGGSDADEGESQHFSQQSMSCRSGVDVIAANEAPSSASSTPVKLPQVRCSESWSTLMHL